MTNPYLRLQYPRYPQYPSLPLTLALAQPSRSCANTSVHFLRSRLCLYTSVTLCTESPTTRTLALTAPSETPSPAHTSAVPCADHPHLCPHDDATTRRRRHDPTTRHDDATTTTSSYLSLSLSPLGHPPQDDTAALLLPRPHPPRPSTRNTGTRRSPCSSTCDDDDGAARLVSFPPAESVRVHQHDDNAFELPLPTSPSTVTTHRARLVPPHATTTTVHADVLSLAPLTPSPSTPSSPHPHPRPTTLTTTLTSPSPSPSTHADDADEERRSARNCVRCVISHLILYLLSSLG